MKLIPLQQEETPVPSANYGPEYEKTEKLRNDIGELKKAMVIPSTIYRLIYYYRQM
jgi:hypothetical protein